MGESVVSDVDGEPIEGQTSPLEGKKHLSIKRVLENTGTEGTEVAKRTTPIQRFQAIPSLSVLIPFIIELLSGRGMSSFVTAACHGAPMNSPCSWAGRVISFVQGFYERVVGHDAVLLTFRGI